MLRTMGNIHFGKNNTSGPGVEGGGGALIFSYVGSFYWIQNFEFQYFLGVF